METTRKPNPKEMATTPVRGSALAPSSAPVADPAAAPAGAPAGAGPVRSVCKPLADLTRDDVVFFRLPHPEPPFHISGRGVTAGNGWFFKHEGFNRFAAAPERIPADATLDDPPADEWLRSYFFDAAKTRALPGELPPRASGHAYRIEDNGGMPFVAYVRSGEVSVFRVARDRFVDPRDWTSSLEQNRQLFTEEVGTYPGHVYVGEDGACGEHGNSLLVQNGDTFVYIGPEILRFTLPGASVVQYHSRMGNSSVPYPVAVMQDVAVFMLDHVSVPRAALEERLPPEGWNDAYETFYMLEETLDKSPLLDLHVLHHREI